MQSLLSTDSQLVDLSLAGNASAFAEIVSRYQSLICSVTYNATGDLARSEELAQDTFVSAWKQLRDLREPHKLRSWLCGIARNTALNAVRRDHRQPHSSSLDELGELATSAPGPHETAITQEEESLLWRSLANIPETYREPLILYYRQGQSTAAVAEALGTSEDAVRQQLSRGRKLLQEEVTAFVEGALARSAPDRAFTAGVMGAIAPLAGTLPAGIAAKLGAGGLLGTVGGGLLASGIATYLGYQIGKSQARSEAELALGRRFIIRLLFGVAVFVGFVFFLAWVTRVFFSAPGVPYVIGLVSLMALYGLDLTLQIRRHTRALRRMRNGEDHSARLNSQPTRYCSKAKLAGLPLVHIDLDSSATARGWIAIGGEKAYGGLFACGSFAVAPIALGGLSWGLIALGGLPIGLVAFGGCAIGLWSVGGCAIGGWTLGGCALGWSAVGGCALAMQGAYGLFAAANTFAIGKPALAPHANDAAAQAFTHSHAWFAPAPWLLQHYFVFPFLAVAPLVLWALVVLRLKNCSRGR